MVNAMKIIGNFLKNIIVGVWVIIAIATTICLIAMNQYAVSEFGDYSLFAVDNKSLEPEFKKNDLLLVDKDIEDKYDINDSVFFYFNNSDTRSYINYGQITAVDRNKNAQDTFYFGDVGISYGNIIGAGKDTKVVPKLGLLLRVFESQWGFMFLVILPTLLAVVYQIYGIIYEVKRQAKKEPIDEED